MSGNMTKYKNNTGFIGDENKEPELGLFQTVLLSFTVISLIALVFSLEKTQRIGFSLKLKGVTVTDIMVYYMLRRRALGALRHRLVPLYHFDPGECEDWEDELLEDSKKEIFRHNPKDDGIGHKGRRMAGLFCLAAASQQT